MDNPDLLAFINILPRLFGGILHFMEASFPKHRTYIASLEHFDCSNVSNQYLLRHNSDRRYWRKYQQSIYPIYFILPALSIFLREGLSLILLYLALVSILFTINMFVFDYNRDEGSKKIALWFVSIACIGLATYIGYITRP